MLALESIDLSENEWSAPRFTRWCAESLMDDAADDPPANDEDEGDAADARWHRRARQWARAVDAEASSSDADDANDDAVDRAYSRQRIPLAAGFPAIARPGEGAFVTKMFGRWPLGLGFGCLTSVTGQDYRGRGLLYGPETTDYRAIHVGRRTPRTRGRRRSTPSLAWRMSGCSPRRSSNSLNNQSTLAT